MQSRPRNALKSFQPFKKYLYGFQTRQISLTGAIERGIRNGQRVREGRNEEQQEVDQRRKKDTSSSNLTRWHPKANSTIETRSHTGTAQREADSFPPTPESVPYTKADSEFIYGTFAVKAALTARRRILHRLYVYVPEADEGPSGTEIEDDAKRAKLNIERVSGKAWLQTLGRMCQGRPHNGYVLEASPLPIPLVSALKPCRSKSHTSVAAQTTYLPREERTGGANLNFQDYGIEDARETRVSRFPFYILLDRILDPGNLGAIVRSAYFFGVDRLILLEHGTAPLSPVTVKASAGATEYLPMLRVKDEINFIQESKANGWRFFGAIAPTAPRPIMQVLKARHERTTAETALRSSPTVLVLGSEGEGIRPRLARVLDGTVSIAGTDAHPGVDSLNVSVAASILIRDFLLPYSSTIAMSRVNPSPNKATRDTVDS